MKNCIITKIVCQYLYFDQFHTAILILINHMLSVKTYSLFELTYKDNFLKLKKTKLKMGICNNEISKMIILS